MKHSIKQYLIPGLIGAYAVGVLVIHIVVDDVHFTITAMGFATLLVGVAAMITAIVKWSNYRRENDERAAAIEARQDKLEHVVNGGLQDHDVIVKLGRRMDRFERERDECLEKYDEIVREVGRRLDESGVGRSEPRGDTDGTGSETES